MITSLDTPLSPSVTSAFQGCLFSPSSLFLLKYSSFYGRTTKGNGIPLCSKTSCWNAKDNTVSQKYRYFPLDFFARNPTATGLPHLHFLIPLRYYCLSYILLNPCFRCSYIIYSRVKCSTSNSFTTSDVIVCTEWLQLIPHLILQS